jgi:cell division septation protein DedD
VGLLQWGDHFLSPGPTGGIHRLLQLWAASRPTDESVAAPPASAAPSPTSDAPASPPVVVVVPPAAVPAAPDSPATPAPPPAPPLTIAPAPALPAPAPVAKATPPEGAQEPREDPTPAASATPPPIRYALALGTFSLSEDAERIEAKLNQAGLSTVRFRQQTPAKLFAVLVSSLKDPEEGQVTVERLQKDGYPPSVLLVGRTGVTVRVGSPAPLRSAVQLAEKLRAGGYDARVATVTAHAGQVNLRHGNFASRAEAEAASREVARLGVPNEVIQVR